jgi:hypothetical protein
MLSMYSAWRNRDINPDADELAEELQDEDAKANEAETGGKIEAPGQPTAENTNVRFAICACYSNCFQVA